MTNFRKYSHALRTEAWLWDAVASPDSVSIPAPDSIPNESLSRKNRRRSAAGCARSPEGPTSGPRTASSRSMDSLVSVSDSALGSGHVLGGMYSSSESDISSSDPELKSSRMDRIPAGESPPGKTSFVKVRK